MAAAAAGIEVDEEPSPPPPKQCSMARSTSPLLAARDDLATSRPNPIEVNMASLTSSSMVALMLEMQMNKDFDMTCYNRPLPRSPANRHSNLVPRYELSQDQQQTRPSASV